MGDEMGVEWFPLCSHFEFQVKKRFLDWLIRFLSNSKMFIILNHHLQAVLVCMIPALYIGNTE